MRVLDTLVPLLIAGILSSTIAEENVRREGSRTISGLLTYVTFMTRPAQAEFILIEQCDKYGGETAYRVFTERLENATECLESVMNLPKMRDEMIAALADGKVDIFSKKYSGMVPNSVKCLEPYFESILPCLIPEERESIEVFRNISSSIFEFIFQGEGTRFATFVEAHGVECLSSKREALENCRNQSFVDYNSVLDEDPENVTLTLASNGEDCSAVQDYQQCTVAVLKECSDPTAANMADAFFKFIFETSPCANWYEQQLTATTETAVTVTDVPEKSVPCEKNDFESFSRQKCEKNGGPTAFEDAEEGYQFSSKCTKFVGDRTQLIAEATDAAVRSSGKMDKVIKKYCRKAPILNECNKYFVDSMKPCLEPEEQKTADIIQNMSISWLDFICHNGGERFLIIATSHAVDCLVSKLNAIQTCGERIFESYIPGLKSLETPFVINAKVCTDLNKLRDCSINLLNECADKTSLNLFNSAYEVLYNETSCQNLLAPFPTEIPISTIAAESVSQPEEEVRKESDLQNLLILIGNSYILDSENESVKRFLQTTCEKNAGPTAYDAVKELPEYLLNGMRLLRLKTWDFDVEVNVALSNGKLNNTFKQFCRVVPDIEDFVKNVTESVKICLKPEDREDLALGRKVGHSLLEFLCQNDGSRFATFITSTDRQCLLSNKLAVRKCMDDDTNESNSSSSNQRDFRSKVLNFMKMARKCVVQAMKECDDKTDVDFVVDMINFVEKEIPSYKNSTLL